MSTSSASNLGRSSDVKVDNNFLVVFTINGGDFSADILDRSIPINLFYDGDVNGVKFPVPDLLNFISTNRMEIFGELLGMWSKWVDAGKPAATVKHRFQRWAETIGGVLETNGHFGFLKSQHSNLGARSAEVRQLIQLITTVEIGRPYTAGQLLTQSIAMGLFEDLARGSERSARNAEFGRLLSSLLGKKFPFRNRQVQLRKGERNSENIPTYIFSFTETALRVAEESQLSLPAEKNNNSCDLAAAGEEEKRNSEVKPDKNASQFWWQK